MEPEVKKKNKLRPIMMGLLLVAIIVAGAIYFIGGNKYETTDNAQLDGNIVPVRASVTAIVRDIRFNDNQLVKKGDTLIQFDAEELLAKVQQAQAMLENAHANLLAVQNKATASVSTAAASGNADLSNQQSVLSQQLKLDKAQKDLERLGELVKIKAATQEQYDNAASAVEIAKAEYARNVDQKRSSASSYQASKSQSMSEQNQVELARALIKQREAELVLAEKLLSYTTIIAPCNGVVTKRAIQEGQYVSTGQSLCSVVENDAYWISANFKETQLEKVKIGNEVDIELDAFPELHLKGKVESYSGATGAKFSLLPPDNATGNFIKITQRFPVRIAIVNFPKDKAPALFPGLSAFVKVSTN